MLDTIAWISLALAMACALWIVIDESRHSQSMAVMNLVWPVTALYFSVFALWAYYRIGRKRAGGHMHITGDRHAPSAEQMPMHGGHALSPASVAIGTSHCGAGCMIADLLCEFAIAAGGLSLFGSVLWAKFAIDFAAAWALGIVFQYFAIKPMRKITAGKAVVAAIKADTLSIAAFQLGMYAWMALVCFRLFPQPHLTPFQPAYWLMMQIAMICGFATSYPMNRWLIRRGIKEAM